MAKEKGVESVSKHPNARTLAVRLNKFYRNWLIYKKCKNYPEQPIKTNITLDKINKNEEIVNERDLVYFRLMVKENFVAYQILKQYPDFYEAMDKYLETFCKKFHSDPFFLAHSDTLIFDVKDYIKSRDIKLLNWED